MKKNSKISFALAVALMCVGGEQSVFADEIRIMAILAQNLLQN